MKAYFRISLICLYAVFLLTSCSSFFSAQQPKIDYAEKFTYATNAEAAAVEENWWKTFASDQLNQLMQIAEEKNLDLQMAAERVKQAELQLKIANASWFPSLDASASTGENINEAADGSSARGESTRASVSLRYEVDLWGGIAAGRISSKQLAQANVYNQQAAILSIKAALANGWFDYLALNERIKTVENNIAIAKRIQNIVDAKYRNGAVSLADVAQQKTNLLSQQASLLPLELQRRQLASALAILLGQSPQGFSPSTADLLAINVPQISPGMPADLITRRPDIAAREASLIAANADIHQARTALLPSINLSASMSRSAAELFSLNPATKAESWSLSLAQTIFAGGRLVNQKKLAESKAAESLLQYHQSLLVALQEVDDALAAVDISSQQEESQQQIVEQAKLSLSLIELRYREGSVDLLSLLDAQRTLVQAEDSLIQQRLSRLKAAVNLYKALGGGWLK